MGWPSLRQKLSTRQQRPCSKVNNLHRYRLTSINQSRLFARDADNVDLHIQPGHWFAAATYEIASDHIGQVINYRQNHPRGLWGQDSSLWYWDRSTNLLSKRSQDGRPVRANCSSLSARYPHSAQAWKHGTEAGRRRNHVTRRPRLKSVDSSKSYILPTSW